jgi:hypothetical protein
MEKKHARTNNRNTEQSNKGERGRRIIKNERRNKERKT